MGSSEEEESGMESGVDTYSRSCSSRRGEEREEVREVPAKVEEGETLGGDEGETHEENEAGNSRKRKRSENILDPKRLKVQGISKQCSNAAVAAGESEVENNNMSSKKFHLLPLQPQALNSPKQAEEGAAVAKSPAPKGKEPIPSCIKKKVKKFNGTNTIYYYHACDDYNYEDMRQVDQNCVHVFGSLLMFSILRFLVSLMFCSGACMARRTPRAHIWYECNP